MSHIVITCEHASKAMPAAFAHLFNQATLDSHRGWDAGALELAQGLSKALGAPLFAGTWSRLLVDLNRSAHHPGRIPGKRQLSTDQHAELHNNFWQPYRTQVAEAVQLAIAAGGRCVHLSVHSFTPVLGDQHRKTEIGLLYDPARVEESQLATQLQQALKATTGLIAHRNQPYRGVADGHTTALRRQFTANHYAGLEIEISQALVDAVNWNATTKQLVEIVGDVVATK